MSTGANIPESSSMPTPPLSENGDSENPGIKFEDFEANLTQKIKEELQGSVKCAAKVDGNKKSTVATSSKQKSAEKPETPKRKRGRPRKSEQNAEIVKKKPKTSDGAKTRENQKVKTEIKAENKNKGTSAATEIACTSEQDAYLCELYTSSKGRPNVKEIHAKFVERYNTGKNKSWIKNRWYKLKEGAIVLTEAEKSILRHAIKTVENNKPQAVMNDYHKKGGDSVTKLTQGYISKIMRDLTLIDGTQDLKGEEGNGEEAE